MSGYDQRYSHHGLLTKPTIRIRLTLSARQPKPCGAKNNYGVGSSDFVLQYNILLMFLLEPGSLA